MGRVLKLLAIVAGALLVLVIVALVSVTLIFDPNDYKTEIVTAVDDATGRMLTLEGDLQLEVLPRVRIALGPAEISNAPGFGNAPFARIQAARLDVALWPLLMGRIAIGEARLEGLTLNLARNARGENNWQDLAGEAVPSAPAEAPPASAGELDLDVGALSIVDANLNWSDAASGASWRLQHLNVRTSGFGPGVAFPVELDFRLEGDQVAVDVGANMQATLALAENRYRLENLEVEIDGEGDAWPGGRGEATIRSALFDADLAAETLDLEGFKVAMLGLGASGNLKGEHLLGNLALNGTLEIAPFDPRDVLEALGVELETADAAVLRHAEGKARLVFDANQTMLADLALTLDDSRLTGRAGMRRGALDFDLNIDSINIDRYLPPAEEGAGESDEGSLDAVDLPLDVLKTLKASGQLAIAQTELIGLKLADTRFKLTAGNGELSLTPQAALYGGRYGGEIRVSTRGAAPAINLEQTLTGVDMAPLAEDLLGEAMVAGTGDARLSLTGTGSNLGAVRRGLDGNVAFTIKDGAWEGLDLWYELRRARAVFDGNEAPPREGPRRTPFSSVSATGTIEDAVLTNRDLAATLPFLTVSGAGTVNLLSDAMSFDLTARFIDGATLQSDPAMASLAGQQLPLKVGGTLSEPTVTPDYSAIVRARVESEVRERVDERTQDLKDRLQDRLRNLRGPQ
jgi:AsmA protein